MDDNMKAVLQRVIDTVKSGANRSDPNLFQPGSEMGLQVFRQAAQRLGPMNSPVPFKDLSVQDKIQYLKDLGEKGLVRGATEGVGNFVNDALTVSPPGQLATYALGNPDPKQQAMHAIRGALSALTFGSMVRPFTASPFQSVPVPGSENAKWVSDLLGGIR